MKANVCIISSTKLLRQSDSIDWSKPFPKTQAQTWVDVTGFDSAELRSFLAPLDLHPLLLERCLDQAISPGVITFGKAVLMEYPASFDNQTAEPAYLTILLQPPYLVTIRHGPLPALDGLIAELTDEHAHEIHHLTQLLYQVMDEFADELVHTENDIRDQLLGLTKKLADNPAKFDANKLSHLRWLVANLVSLVENQLYCASSLAALDLKELQEPHRKAYIQDLLGEAEITQRGVYRLEARLNDLYNDYQMVESGRVEKRLRLLTIVSAITLPLGLITGLLGMNVGGVPGTTNVLGFTIVMIIMLVIALALFLYFKSKSWFD